MLCFVMTCGLTSYFDTKLKMTSSAPSPKLLKDVWEAQSAIDGGTYTGVVNYRIAPYICRPFVVYISPPAKYSREIFAPIAKISPPSVSQNRPHEKFALL